jgi:ribonuclease D
MFQCLQVLGREERSLANLLRRYCSVTQDKTHQTADWRLRPLPQVLQQYARGDVHWLPYLAGRLVAELQARSPSTSGVGSLTLTLCYITFYFC